jgi:hypothetical protein
MIDKYRETHGDVIALKGLDLFTKFSKWMTQAKIPLQIIATQFGRTLITLMKLTPTIQKRRLGQGVVYEIDLYKMHDWMVENKYIDDGAGLGDKEKSTPLFDPENPDNKPQFKRS